MSKMTGYCLTRPYQSRSPRYARKRPALVYTHGPNISLAGSSLPWALQTGIRVTATQLAPDNFHRTKRPLVPEHSCKHVIGLMSGPQMAAMSHTVRQFKEPLAGSHHLTSYHGF